MPEETNVIPFLRTHSFELHADDGRRWCASVYICPEGLDRMTPGRTYSVRDLFKKFGLYPRDGRPGLYLEAGEELPEEVTYVVERLKAGQE